MQTNTSIKEDLIQQQILQAAQQLFQKHGYQKATMDDFANSTTAISMNPSDANCYDDKAMPKSLLHNYNLSIEDENKAIKINPRDESFYCNRGYSELKLGMFSDAINDFNQSISIKPLQRAYVNRGDAYYETKDYTHAISDFTKSLEFNSGDYLVFYLRGLSYKAAGQLRNACLDFTMSANLDYGDAKEMQTETCH
jgi:tetratricopeptide (TPR) repeat protein